jgi:hypothetical protein
MSDVHTIKVYQLKLPATMHRVNSVSRMGLNSESTYSQPYTFRSHYQSPFQEVKLSINSDMDATLVIHTIAAISSSMLGNNRIEFAGPFSSQKPDLCSFSVGRSACGFVGQDCHGTQRIRKAQRAHRRGQAAVAQRFNDFQQSKMQTVLAQKGVLAIATGS